MTITLSQYDYWALFQDAADNAPDEVQVLKTLPVDGDRPITSNNLETPDMIRDYID